MSKPCTKCNHVAVEFRIRKNGKRNGCCRACEREYAARYRQARQALCNSRTARWQALKRDFLNSQRRKQYAKNPDFFRRRARNWQKKNPGKAYRSAVNWQRGKSESAARFRLATGLRNRINKALKGVKKSAGTIALLGCSISAFRAHLEKQFRPGMSWDARGLWHIDHIKPCAKFDLKDPSQQRACFHFSNLQPLWAEENLQKGDKA